MAPFAETAVLAVMALFGLATAGVLALALRDMIAEVAGDDVAAADARRVAMLGPPVYLVGFLVVLAATLVELEPVAGVNPIDVGLGIIILAAVPMAAGFYLAWR